MELVGLVGLGGEVSLASPWVGLGSLCCRRGSSGLFHLLGWPPMCSEDFKTGLSGRPFPQYLNAQWGLAVGSSGDHAWVSLGRSSSRQLILHQWQNLLHLLGVTGALIWYYPVTTIRTADTSIPMSRVLPHNH